jgi:ribosome-associated heat shock protein Hsp15
VESKAAELDAVRVDKWLWAARLFKTRTLASDACAAGHVKIDGDSVKASRLVRRGERIECLTPGGQRVVEVVELALRRLSAPLARTLYIDHTPPPPPPEERQARPHRERGLGRPSKRDRRRLERLRGR